jgi:hypothetical protein
MNQRPHVIPDFNLPPKGPPAQDLTCTIMELG